MMHERGKSDFAGTAVKPANKAERSAAELVEQRAGTKGKRISKARAGLRNGKCVTGAGDAYGKLGESRAVSNSNRSLQGGAADSIVGARKPDFAGLAITSATAVAPEATFTLGFTRIRP